MTLPASAPLTLTEILDELGRLSAGQTLSGASDERALCDVASGSIDFSDYLGKSSFHTATRVDSFTASFTGDHTFTGVDFGEAYTGRTLILIVTSAFSSGSTGASISSATVGGTAVTELADHGSFNATTAGSAVWIGAVKATGTSGDVFLNFPGSTGKSVFCTLWAVEGIGTLTAYDSAFASGDDSGTGDTLNLDVPSNGVLFMGWAGLPNIGSGTGVSFSGITGASNGAADYRFDALNEQLSAATNKAVSWSRGTGTSDVTFVVISMATS